VRLHGVLVGVLKFFKNLLAWTFTSSTTVIVCILFWEIGLGINDLA
jgi:hypothetical protein